MLVRCYLLSSCEACVCMLTAGGRGGGCVGWGTRSLGLDDLPEPSDQALVVLHGVQLDARLDDIHGAHAAMSDRAAQTSAKSAIQVVPAEWRRIRRSGHNAAAKTSKRKTKDCILRVVLVPVVHRSTVTDHSCTIPCRVASVGNARIEAFEARRQPARICSARHLPANAADASARRVYEHASGGTC